MRLASRQSDMSSHNLIPFNQPRILGRELDYIKEAVSRRQLAGDGHFTERCQQMLAEITGVHSALLTHSCTAALEMAAILCKIGPGDEVIMPSFTFVSTANAVVLRGGIPVFVDVRADTLNLDETLVEAAVTERTKAIWPVHYAGVPAEMDAINAIAQKHDLLVVEDAAQALGSTYHGRAAGNLGDLAALSFHETKSVISGEGGAILLPKMDHVERAEIIREKGTNRKRFFRGQVDKYTWVDIGSSFLPGELIAAFLFAQLEHASRTMADRLMSWQVYDEALRPFHNSGIKLPSVPSHCTHNGHIYYLVMPDMRSRTELIALLRQEGITAPFHYVPLHSAPAGRRFGRVASAMTQTDIAGERLVRLPLFIEMGEMAFQVAEAVTRQLRAVTA